MDYCSEVKKLEEFLQNIALLRASNERDLLREYDCLKPCKYMEYKVILILMYLKPSIIVLRLGQIKEEPLSWTYEEKNTRIWLAFTSPKVIVSKQMWSYSISSFVADYGGLLGLFVGFNFLMIWDFAILLKQKIN